MKWPLKKKLYVSFGVLITMMALLGIVSYLRLEQSAAMHQRQIDHERVAQYSDKMMTTLLQSRRHEKDFFARLGDEKYLKMHHDRELEFKDYAVQARKLLDKDDAQLLRQLNDAELKYHEYDAAFGKAAELFVTRGTHENGLQKQFRDLAHEAEALTDKQDNLELKVYVLQMRRAEKDFLLRNLPKYRDLFMSTGAEATLLAQRSGARDLAAILTEYVKKFDEAYVVSQQFDESKVALHQATEAIDKVLTAVEEEAILINDRIAKESTDAQRQTGITMLIVFALAIVVGLGVARVLSGQLSRAVEQLITGTRKIADGNLTANVEVVSNDELGELATTFNVMTKSLRDMAMNVTDASESLSQVIQELQATVSEQGAALQQQASSVSETVATVEEMSRSSGQVSDTAGQVLNGATRSLQTSEDGKSSIQQSVQGMHDVREQVQNIAKTILELSDKTQQIGTIIATVDDFAEQSSLLALNASIEAARAGEDGKAFGVVAGEVKNLAEQSQQATEKVRTILSEIQRATHTAVMVTEEGSKRVDRGVELVNSAGEIIRALATSISDSADSAKQIASAARQQSNGVEQINVAIAGIDQFSRQNLEAIRQTEATAQTLASVSQQLRSSSERYVL